VLGEQASCADKYPQYPRGTTTCGVQGFPSTTCHVCETGDTVDCSEIPNNTAAPYGKASCDPLAALGKGDWLRDDCRFCEAGISEVDCVKLPGGLYTGGRARCNATGDGWLTEHCAVCGDGSKNEAEQCDGSDVTPSTCGALDFGGGDPNTPVTACAPNCNYDTSACGHCGGGVAAGACMESGMCSGPQCNGKGCARDGNCQFWCRDSAANKCRYAVCSERATCRFDCYNQGGCEDAQCRPGASCQFSCQNKLAECKNITCDVGARCDIVCSDGGTCSTKGAIHCVAGDECTLNCSNQGHCAEVSLVCDPGSICHLHADNTAAAPQVDCQSGATCYLHCAGADCASIKCAGSGCKCDAGTCAGFP
jgi:hypothetical protein